MKILLTGGSGFIGRELLPSLIERGHEVSVLTASEAAFSSQVSEIFRAPLNEWGRVTNQRQFDACVHLAWIATPGIYLESSLNNDFSKVTAVLAETLFDCGLKHFVGVGTGIEYQSGQTFPCSEERTPILPRSAYGEAKEEARSALAESSSRHQAAYTWGRIFYPYGVSEHPSRIPTTFLNTLKSGTPLILKTPDSIKDFVSVHDVVSALVHLLESGIGRQEINIGSGCGHRIGELAELAAELVDADPSLIRHQPPSTPDLYSFHVADISKLKATGWHPQISLRKGLFALAETLDGRKRASSYENNFDC